MIRSGCTATAARVVDRGRVRRNARGCGPHLDRRRQACARAARADTFASVSPGMLPPLGIVFALVVGFLAAGVWNDGSNARSCCQRRGECRCAAPPTCSSGSFPERDAAARMRLLSSALRSCRTSTVTWPAMARRQETLTVIPTAALADALRLALQLRPRTAGQSVAQRETRRLPRGTHAPWTHVAEADHRQPITCQLGEMEQVSSHWL